MTCALVTPWWRARATDTAATEVDGEVAATAILNWRHPRVAALLDVVRRHEPADAAELLRVAHHVIADTVRPVYSVDDAQPVSRTLRRGRGSCSQRLAALEAVARASGVPTRVRGLLVDGSFWYPRFPRLRFLVPDRVLLAWPEFLLGGSWIQAAELFGSLAELGDGAASGFTNADGETLFDALSRTAVDWNGVTSLPGACSACDLSATVLADLGRFPSRDALFAAHGQTLSPPVRTLAEPVLSRWSPVQ
ncbi:transglutaminase domain-containing protein [Solihabitans fulvus]|uniref:Transglutaminase domain-containing protein n=1 Tax=Solihabitans fulvus TaxID=1892852 RepID=A0A5B2WVP6_9PSEU|nr:transglutaminase domain-containing protein [Solihabitans fulvus]KAA2254519.1 transglutaminase domain-containing protein [Solihabitans fulvus]